MKNKNKYKIFVDMDGVLCAYMTSVLTTMNKFTKAVNENQNLYLTKYPDLYKAAKKAVGQQDGNLDNGDIGAEILYEDVCRETTKKHVRNLMYSLVSNDYKFWAQLDWMPDGKDLWSYIQKYNPTIISGPQGPNSKTGKMEWCRRELGLGKDKVILTHTKHEAIREVQKEGKVALLIDDMPKYVVPWQNAGGIAIFHKSAQVSIDELKNSYDL
jgi:hypothetical protein